MHNKPDDDDLIVTFFEVIVQLVLFVECFSALSAKEVFYPGVDSANVSIEMPLFEEGRSANAAFVFPFIRVINFVILQFGPG